MYTKLKSLTQSLFLALVFAFGLIYVHAAWTEPTAAPPGGNVEAPINVGSISQTKSGGLGAGSLLTTGSIRTDARRYYFGANQDLYGDNSSALYWNGGHDTVTQLIMRDNQDTTYGRLYGGGDGVTFGLLDGDAQWSYLAAKDTYTDLRINNGIIMRLLANGNVGIGNTSPSYKLDVSGPIRGSGELMTTSANALRMVYGNYGMFFRNDGSNVYLLSTASGNQYGGWNTLRPFRVNNASGDTFLGNNTLTVMHGGNVGIGNTSPAEKLDVTGNAAISGYVKVGEVSVVCNSSRGGVIRYDGVNNVMQYCNTTEWVDMGSSVVSGGSPTPLYGGTHTDVDCLAVGGLTTPHNGEQFCRFISTSCPAGWTRYQNLGTTQPYTCNGNTCGVGTQCTTLSHTFSNVATEYCMYNRDYMNPGGGRNPVPYCGSMGSDVCYAQVTSVGCY